MPEFLLQSRGGWPQPAQEASTNEPSEVSKMADSTSLVVDSTKPDSANLSQDFLSSDQSHLVPRSPKHPLLLVELDPQGLNPKQAGAKLDSGKVDTLRGAIQYFPRALSAVAHVSELGAKKYSWMGWRTVPDGIRRYGAALARHLIYEHDARDTGAGGLGPDVLHAAQVAWNSLARLELIIQEEDEKAKDAK
jgi:hypothetical protein